MAKWIKYILFFGIGILLLYLAFNNQNPKELIEQLKTVDYLWVWLSMLFGFLAFISRGIRWIILIENLGYQAKSLNSIYAVSIGYFTNLAIPRAGEVTRCTSLSQSENIPVNKLFGTIILERTIDFIFLVSLICFTFLVEYDAFSQFFTNLFADGKNSTSNIGFITIAIFSSLLLLFLLFKNKLKQTAIYQKIASFLQGVADGFKSIKGIQNKWAFWGHTLFIWLMYYLMTYICFFAIESTQLLSPIDGLFIMVVGGLGMVAPVQGGIGAYHLVVKIGLMILGISADAALLFATLVHTCQTLMTLFVGSISLLMLFLSKRKVKSESAQ
tara:strand:+ start:4636 stop:5619 length:984 start_codon:yes stop_codon:yes gene_type:complete